MNKLLVAYHPARFDKISLWSTYIRVPTKQGKWLIVTENKSNLEILTKHRDFGLLKL